MGSTFSEVLNYINGLVWGLPLIAFILGMHVYLTYRTGFVQRHLWTAIKLTFSKETSGKGDISPFSALAVALAATIGTGNIIGVATAIELGGPGAVFWMWISGVLGIATKYSEALLAVKYRVHKGDGQYAGGPMYTIEHGMGPRWKWLAVLFAVFTSIAAFGIGNMVQCNSIALLLQDNYAVPAWFSGTALAIMTALVIIGGVKGIARASTAFLPCFVGLYIVACFILLAINIDKVPAALLLIVKDAFTGEAALGGFAGAGIAAAVRFGVARGLFSNESGLGSAPIVAAAAKTTSPVRQALVSSTGTFWDTVVMCLLMGVVLVASGAWCATGPDGSLIEAKGMTKTAFAQLGFIGPHFLAIVLFSVVLSTVLGWSYYGERAFEYLFGERAVILYRLMWVVAVVCGSFFTLKDVFAFGDIANGLMAIPNLISLLVLNGVIAHETKHFFKAGPPRI